MATIRKRIGKSGKVSWQIDYFDPTGKRVRQSFKKKKVAEAELGKRVSLIREKRYLDVKKEFKTMLGELCDKYDENFKGQASYISAKYYFIKDIKSHFGEETLLANIRYVDLETYKNKLRQTMTHWKSVRTDAAVNRQMSCLRHLFTKAVEWDMIEQNPFSKGKSLNLKENNAQLRYLRQEEILRLLDACRPSLRHFVVFCIHTGARKQEAIYLKRHQIRGGYVYFQKTKTNNPRQVPIDNDLKELLDKLQPRSKDNVVSITGNPIEPARSKSDYVFLNKGKPFGRDNIQKLFKNACKRAGIPYGRKTPDGVTIHTLRHTFASYLVMKGVSLKTVQELMGHKNISMTMRYAHLADNVKQEAVQALNGLTSKATCHKTVTFSENANNTVPQPTEKTTIL